MRKLFNKIRNLLTATAGSPVNEPEMVTKELPSAYQSKETDEQEDWTWKDTVDVCIDAFVEFSKSIGKLIGSALMWSIFLYAAGYFIQFNRFLSFLYK